MTRGHGFCIIGTLIIGLALAGACVRVSTASALLPDKVLSSTTPPSSPTWAMDFWEKGWSRLIVKGVDSAWWGYTKDLGPLDVQYKSPVQTDWDWVGVQFAENPIYRDGTYDPKVPCTRWYPSDGSAGSITDASLSHTYDGDLSLVPLTSHDYMLYPNWHGMSGGEDYFAGSGSPFHLTYDPTPPEVDARGLVVSKKASLVSLKVVLTEKGSEWATVKVELRQGGFKHKAAFSVLSPQHDLVAIGTKTCAWKLAKGEKPQGPWTLSWVARDVARHQATGVVSWKDLQRVD